MVFIVLAVLSLLALAAKYLQWRRGFVGLVGLALLLFFAVACGPVPRWLLGQLQRPYAVTLVGAWAPRNAIVLLTAGTTRMPATGILEPSLFAYGRIVRAAMLYRDCKASGQQCRLLVTGGDSQHHGAPESVVYGAVLRQLGVSATDLQQETRSMNTWQNAKFTRPLLQAYAPQKLLLVTSGIHLRRSMLYFRYFGLRPEPVRADALEAIMSPWPRAWNLTVCDAAIHEYLGIARFYVYNALGWNIEPPRGPLIPARVP
ncbi:MAG: YdcF family protein [Rhodanobacter sp.]|nr:MAG: YdcF family protein [Rhodanobacter sp.]